MGKTRSAGAGVLVSEGVVVAPAWTSVDVLLADPDFVGFEVQHRSLLLSE